MYTVRFKSDDHSFIIILDLSLIGEFYVTHVSRILKSHDLSGDGISYGSNTYFLTSPGHGAPPQSDHLNAGATSEITRTLKTIHIIHSVIPTRQIWNDDDDGQMIFGDLGGLKFPDIFVLQVRKNPEKTSARKLVPTRDRTGARCVTSAHATACSTEVDLKVLYIDIYIYI